MLINLYVLLENNFKKDGNTDDLILTYFIAEQMTMRSGHKSKKLVMNFATKYYILQPGTNV